MRAPGSPQTCIALASTCAEVDRTEEARHERAEFLKQKQLTKKSYEK